ncbi:sensor histidine kinase [Rivularia sp. UHCC 0363]|uniref:sensor histidine kinase n=1 Tax=Rivularia sp. UHCC 0363 TaxID=3110244 RepID=UPI002B20E230|nr:ATP-binding protein [Rivularia sp. UHCC 0363]MEA5597200.1 ATP-binding protein [Rivularia sp. UHCC 0363]
MLSTIFIPHGHCYLWKTGLVSLHLISDSLITVAYFLIPIMLVYIVNKREDVPFDWIFLCFGAFIVLCGFTHLAEVWTLWHPNYWVSGWLKASTAVVSLGTAALLFWLTPKLLAIPNVPKLSALNVALEKEIIERKLIETKLSLQTQQLEETLLQLQRTQAQMIQTEKMSGLGQMVAGVAHEINNPVSFVYSNLVPAREYAQDFVELLELYQQEYPRSSPKIQDKITEIDLDFIKDDFMKLLDSMEVGTERIYKIVLSLRNFSRLDEAEFKKVDIHDGVDSTLMILGSQLKAASGHDEIQIIKEYGDIPLVECYPSQLNQVFMNIIANAIDAFEEKQDNSSNQITISTEKLDNNFIAIAIADNACGIPSEISKKVFDPFFTTKQVGKGTGLGLSISYEIVTDKHGGKLSFDSIPMKGTKFVIEIPITHKK